MNARPPWRRGTEQRESTRARRERALARVIASAAIACSLVGVTRAQEPDTVLWGPNANVLDIARSGDKLYIAGAFTQIGPNTGSGVPLDRASGAIVRPFAKVAGTVNAVVADGQGGWFIGGWFVAVGGEPRAGLAHVLASGRVAQWNPGQDGLVEALALRDGVLYVAGSFTRLGGAARRCLGALDAETGSVTAWDPSPNRRVHALWVRDSTLYAGGEFDTIASVARNSLAEVELQRPAVTSWDPSVGFSGFAGTVRAIAVAGDTVYFGGSFGNVGGVPRYNVGAVDARTAMATDWDPFAASCNCNDYDPSPYVSELALTEQTVLIAGHFSTVGGLDRGGVAEVDRILGAPTEWDPQVGPRYPDYAPIVTALAVAESTVYVSGYFHSVGEQERFCLAEIELSSGGATDWNPRPNGPAYALSVSSGTVFAGGLFESVGEWVNRRHLAVLDAKTGRPTDWDPSPDGLGVQGIAVDGDRVYVSGHFSTIGGQERSSLAALDTLTGQALPWAPNPNYTCGPIKIADGRLYVVGGFTAIGGVPRGRAASFDLATGELTSWDPNASDEVYDVAVIDRVAFIGGFFRTVGGLPRSSVAAVDATSGAVLDWNPVLGAWVDAIEANDSTVFIGGGFQVVNGLPRERFAALDAKTGELRDWSADASLSNPYLARVFTLDLVHDTLYAGGNFDHIAGQPRSSLVALDAESGRVLDWDPHLGGLNGDPPPRTGVIWSVSAIGNTLFVGGSFGWAGTDPISCFAALSRAPQSDTIPEPTPIPMRLAIDAVSPNPVRSNSTIRFSIPTLGPVTLAIFDLQGRRVETLLKDEPLLAGVHVVRLPATDRPIGCYFCRLQSGGKIATRKFIALR